jgi:uncharacterized SAM-binding protein YcdF (DUF218 family)
MLHHLSKLTSFIWDPAAWLVALLALGVALLFFRNERSHKWGRRVCVLTLFLFAFLSWRSIPDTLISKLEGAHEVPTDISKFHGVVVLGGAFSSGRARGTILPALSCSAERMTEAVPLMKENPHLQLLFAGGDARLVGASEPESDNARNFFERMEVDASRVRFESKSRNTFENAMNAFEVAGADNTKPWLLLTSAWHMPRALATFQKAGWNVTPYPVDHYAPNEINPFDFSVSGGLESWQLLIREVVGGLIYKLLGRS